MKKISIVYGSSTGNTEAVAEIIKNNIEGDATVYDVTNVTDEVVKEADLVLFGSSTWGYGELQDDFAPYYDKLSSNLLSGKDVAIFGCGDKVSFADVFCEATEIIKTKVEECGAKVIIDLLKIDGDPSDSEDEIKAFAKAL